MMPRLYSSTVARGHSSWLTLSFLVLSASIRLETEIMHDKIGGHRNLVPRIPSTYRLGADTYKDSSAPGLVAQAPQAIASFEIQFNKDNFARIRPKIHAAVLKQVANKVKPPLQFKLFIDGHRDASERPGISLTRANNVRDNLVQIGGIERGKIEVRNYSATCPKGERMFNRRVQIWVLPKGNEESDIEAVKKCLPGSTPKIVTNEIPIKSADPSFF